MSDAVGEDGYTLPTSVFNLSLMITLMCSSEPVRMETLMHRIGAEEGRARNWNFCDVTTCPSSCITMRQGE